MMNHRINMDDLRAKIQTFRVSDLQSLVASFGRSRNGKKQELQNRALEILRTQPSDVDMKAFTAKIYELYRIAQEEAKQSSHYDYQSQRPMIQHPRGANPYANQNYIQPQTGRPVTNTIVYQNGGVGGNGYPATVYATPTIPPIIQPPANIVSNLSSSVKIISPPLSYSNITFRQLPFYKVKHEILKPTLLKVKSNNKTNGPQLFQISFVLTCEIASEISMHRDLTKNEYCMQAQLRICALDNNANPNGGVEYDDMLPLGLFIRMNDRQCPLPPTAPSTRPNTEARRIPLPINVTQFMKLSPMNANKLSINWSAEVGRTFVMCLNVVEKLTSSYLLEKLKQRPRLSVDITKQTIAKQYKRVIDDDDEDSANADDDDIATTIVRVSLQCPLAKFRMMYPAKGKNCSHLQCFDGFAYISCNEKKSVWMCPVCNRTLYYEDLLIDQYFVDVLADEQSADCQEVQLFVDGSWKVYDEDNTNEGNDRGDSQNSVPTSPGGQLSLTNSSDGLSDVDRKNVVSEPLSTVAVAAPLVEPVVDLTMEDEDDDEEIQGQGPNVSSSDTSCSEQVHPMEIDSGEFSTEVGNTSSLPSPEIVSQQNVSPVTNSLASVFSAPVSPISLSSQERNSSCLVSTVNPMVLSRSPSPEPKTVDSQDTGSSSLNDILVNRTPENDIFLDTPLIDSQVDDVSQNKSKDECSEDGVSVTNSTINWRSIKDVSTSNIPVKNSLINEKAPTSVTDDLSDATIEKNKKDTEKEPENLLDTNEGLTNTLDTNEVSDLNVNLETSDTDINRETESSDINKETPESFSILTDSDTNIISLEDCLSPLTANPSILAPSAIAALNLGNYL